jgi:hypothetical protein
MGYLTIYGILFILYIFSSSIFAIALAFKVKPKNMIISSGIVFWLLTFNLYKSPIMWTRLPYVWYFRRFEFYMAWFLIIVLLLVKMSNKKDNESKRIKMPVFEKFLFAYFFFVIGMYLLHIFLGNISEYKGFTFIRLYLETLTIYYTLRFFMTKELIRMMFYTFIFMGLITSFSSIVQFFIDTSFMRVGYFHMAFPGYNRSSGIFYYPYDNGLFTILGVYATAYCIKDLKIKLPIIIFLFINLFLVFTRGTWISFTLVSLFHLWFFYRRAFKRYFTIALILVSFVTMIAGTYYAQKEFFKGEYTERVKSDTVTVRMAFYWFVIQAIPQKPFIGYGDVENNKVYFKGMANAEQSLFWALGKAGGIHNLFLEEAFLRGIFSPILLSAFFIAFFIFSIKLAIKNRNHVFCIPAYYNIGFFIYFMSVSGFLISRSGMLSIPMFAVVSGIYYNKIDLKGILINTNFEYKTDLDKIHKTEIEDKS